MTPVLVTGAWETYTNKGGNYKFNCSPKDRQCRIVLNPPLKAKHVKVYMLCVGRTSSTDKICTKSSTRSIGFAHLTNGKKLQLNLQFKTLMTKFGWTPMVKDELTGILEKSPLKINCTAVLHSCIIDSHFAQWKIPDFGSFAQEPDVESKPISLHVGGFTMNVTASKKRLVTAKESVIEKRMICISAPKRKKECCVTKKVLEMTTNTSTGNATAQARLENF